MPELIQPNHFQLGDTIFYIHDRKIISGAVTGIRRGRTGKVFYSTAIYDDYGSCYIDLSAEHVAESKELILASL